MTEDQVIALERLWSDGVRKSPALSRYAPKVSRGENEVVFKLGDNEVLRVEKLTQSDGYRITHSFSQTIHTKDPDVVSAVWSVLQSFLVNDISQFLESVDQ
jgi:hypothetical protein